MTEQNPNNGQDTQGFLDCVANSDIQSAANAAELPKGGTGGIQGLPVGPIILQMVDVTEGVHTHNDGGQSPWIQTGFLVKSPGEFCEQKTAHRMFLDTSREGKARRGLKDLIKLGSVLLGVERRGIVCLRTACIMGAQAGAIIKATISMYQDKKYIDFQSCETADIPGMQQLLDANPE